MVTGAGFILDQKNLATIDAGKNINAVVLLPDFNLLDVTIQTGSMFIEQGLHKSTAAIAQGLVFFILNTLSAGPGEQPTDYGVLGQLFGGVVEYIGFVIGLCHGACLSYCLRISCAECCLTPQQDRQPDFQPAALPPLITLQQPKLPQKDSTATAHRPWRHSYATNYVA